QTKVLQLIKKGFIQSAEDIAEGGLAVALAEKAIRGNVGINVTVQGDPTVELFSETQSRYVISVKKEYMEAIENSGLEARKIGTVTTDGKFMIKAQNGEKLIDR